MGQFLRALERAEAISRLVRGPVEQLCLSTRMRDSWETGRSWFNYAARMSLDINDIYWHTLHNKADSDIDLLDEATQTEMELLVQMKMEQKRHMKRSVLFFS
jgi:hypothetical protein